MTITMTMTMMIMIILPPLLAWIYHVSVWITYALPMECTWSSKIPGFVLRTSWLIASISTCIAMSCVGNEEQQQQPIDPLQWPKIILMVVVFVLGSMYLCWSTRVYDVIGYEYKQHPLGNHVDFLDNNKSSKKKQRRQFYPLHGKTVLITGSNSGIGKETAAQLACLGATVYLLCRSKSRGQEAIDDIMKQYKAYIPNIAKNVTNNENAALVPLQVVPVDLSNFVSIRKAILILKDQCQVTNVDILINNAGMMNSHYALSVDGYELTMQANHLGHFLLTRLLQDQNMLQKNVRILNLTSTTYEFSKNGFDFYDIMCDKGTRAYTMFGQYSMSKLANILFTKEWSRRNPQHKVFAVHPGLVMSNISSNMNWYWKYPYKIFNWFVAWLLRTPIQGAYASVYCAAAPVDRLPPSGSYIVNAQAFPTNKAADSIDDAKKLWEVSEILVGWKD